MFTRAPKGTLVVAAVEGDRAVVLCAGAAPLKLVQENADEIVRALNLLLDGDVTIKRLDAIPATRTEIYLARDILALKSWLID